MEPLIRTAVQSRLHDPAPSAHARPARRPGGDHGTPCCRPPACVLALAALLTLNACSSEPDILAHGARELPGTLDADYLTRTPFSVAPDASKLIFATRLDVEQIDDAPESFDRHRLASFRLLDLETGISTELGDPPEAFLEELARYGILHEAPCWLGDSRTLVMRTRYRRYVAVGPVDGTPAWRMIRERPPGLDPDCGVRQPPFIGTRPVGRFRVERPNGTALRVRLADGSRALFEKQPGGPGGQVTVSGAELAPDGARLALTYASGTGSFTGKSSGVVLSARAGDPPARPLGSGVLVLDWIDDRRLVGFARPDGQREYALYTWTLD